MLSLLSDLWAIYADYYYPPLTASIKWWIKNAANITGGVGALAVLVGGISAYIRFFYGQLFYYRIDTNVKTELLRIDGVRFLKVRVEAKNIGTVSCHFAPFVANPLPMAANTSLYYRVVRSHHERKTKVLAQLRASRRWMKGQTNPYANNSWIVVLRGRLLTSTSFAFDLQWDAPDSPWGTTQLFANQQWIRSGETIADEYLFQLPADDVVAVRVEARLASKPRILRPCGDEWHAYSVLTIKESQSGNHP